MSRNYELLQKLEQQSRGLEAENRATKMQDWPGAVEAPPDSATSSVDNGQRQIVRLNAASADHVANLVQRLFLHAKGAKAVVLSGAERGAGTTWVAAQIAQVLAAQGIGSVCLIDANLRTPAVHDFFSVSNHYGLSDAAMDTSPVDNYLKEISRNLYLFTCGSTERRDDALLAWEGLRARIKQVRSEFDYVILDSPPLNLYSDASSLASACDGVSLVVKANSSRRESTQKLVGDLKATGVSVLGVILNQRTFPVPDSIYRKL
jgi:capsular exopolysaccharide synthesis family protein